MLQADREGNSVFNVGTGGGRSITLYRNNSRFRFVLPDGVKHGAATEVAEVNCWYHLVGVWNGSAVGIYANGRLVASQPTVGLTLNASSLSAEPARIGALPGAGDPSTADFRGLSAEEIRQLFRLIDWLMDLPREFAKEFQEQIHRFEEERQMPYVTSIERMAREEGLEEGLQRGELRALKRGIEVALELKFGTDGLQLLPLVREVSQVEMLRAVQDSIRTAGTLDEVRSLLM